MLSVGKRLRKSAQDVNQFGTVQKIAKLQITKIVTINTVKRSPKKREFIKRKISKWYKQRFTKNKKIKNL